MTVEVLRTITPSEAVDILKRHGMDIGRTKLCAGIQQNAFPFGTYIAMKHDEYIIYPALLYKWISERLVTEEVPEELAQFMEYLNTQEEKENDT